MRISDWSSDVCSSDLAAYAARAEHRDLRALSFFAQFLRKTVEPGRAFAEAACLRINGALACADRNFIGVPRVDEDRVRVLDHGVPVLALYINACVGGRSKLAGAHGDGLFFQPARKSPRVHPSHSCASRMPSSACK